MVVALCPLKFLRNLSFKGAAIKQAGQWIDLGLVFKVLLIVYDSRADANSGQQLGKGEWFRNIIIRSEIEHPYSIAFLDPGGNQNHVDTFESRVTADALDELKAIHFGHHYVRQRDLNVLFLEFFHGLYAIPRRDDTVAFSLKDNSQEVALIRVVFDDQDG